jgi:hypothetical protein
MTNRTYIKIGTQCETKFGTAKVTGIELCKNGEKYGIGMDKVYASDKDRCTFDFDNGHWQYGTQVTVSN